MAEIGLERYRAGHGKEYRTEREQPDNPVPDQKPHPVERIKREKNFRIPNNGQQTGDADAEEPESSDRAEEGSDLGGAGRLHCKQNDQYQYRERNDVSFEGGGRDFQTFNGGQYRQGRRYHGVAMEQRLAR